MASYIVLVVRFTKYFLGNQLVLKDAEATTKDLKTQDSRPHEETKQVRSELQSGTTANISGNINGKYYLFRKVII